MKKISIILMALYMVFTLGACSSGTADANPKTSDITGKIKADVVFKDQLVELNKDTVNKIYTKLDLSSIEEYSIFVSGTNATAEEIAVLKLKDGAKQDDVKAAFDARIQDQKFRYENYNPQEMVKIKDAVIAAKGNYIILAVADDSAKCEKLFKASIK